jgi:hypothetical protein
MPIFGRTKGPESHLAGDAAPRRVDAQSGRLMPPARHINFRSTCRPTAQTLPLIGGTTAGPAGSSQKNLHRIPTRPEGGIPLSYFAAREAAVDVVDGARSRHRSAIGWSS